MIFIASPYSVSIGTPEERKRIREARYRSAIQACGKLAVQEKNCYSPIVHWHEVAKTFSLEKGNEFWKQFNRKPLLVSHELKVLTLPGWQASKGIEWELEVAYENDIPVEKMHPPTGTIQRQTALLTNAKQS